MSVPSHSPNKISRTRMEDQGSSGSVDDEYTFRPPPEAPVFEPSDEEFLDPLLYINKIRPIAERAGICKIRPPADWQPPFAVDIEKFKFTPRIQRLNELEAKTRIKLNFLDQIAKFWELQGSMLRIPLVERRILDLYTLHKIVQEEGGALLVTRERKWSRIACRMGMPSGKGIGTLLKGHYEKILYPFDVFQNTKQSDKSDASKEDSKEEISELISCIQDYSNTGGNCKRRFERKSMRRSTYVYETEDDPLSELAKYVCRNCNRGDAEASMLLCDGCDDSYHTFCLRPPLSDVPKGDWRCPKCVDEEVSKPSEAFGFEQAQREYTLQQFGEMADQFKSDYFNVPVHRVPMSLVEKEFWRIVSSLDEDITVEYGADLHTMDHGSGFPSKDCNIVKENPEMLKYAESQWNLNNLPVLEASVLGHINADISGMKVPWMYVGMCFATFCWHNEDHWSYSINYLHWGEPKTWYGVPGSCAEIFETAMKNAAPELFQSQPDLLHQLTTIMNPNVLMDAGVPVYRTDQHAGEFVITFPRAYHAGFNQGYNFAEAVNFAPADWLKMGRECITHYASLHRYCVFSHDELVCKMGVHAENLDPRIAAAAYQDMLEMVNAERKMRKSILEWGVSDAEREAFELLPDDERQCELCKTTCFLSAVTCSCSETKLVCLNHYAFLCKCPPESHTLRYRYTLDELPVMLQKLKLKAESFDTWVYTVKDALDCGTPKNIDLEGLKALLFEAESKKFPDSDLLQSLSLAIQEADKCVKVARQLHSNRYRPRTRLSYDCKLTCDELLQFIQQVEGLSCHIKEADLLKNWVKDIRKYEEEARQLMTATIEPNENALRQCLLEGQSLGVDLEILDDIQKMLDYSQWVRLVDSTLQAPQKPDISTLQNLICMVDTFEDSDALSAKIGFLSETIALADIWESKTQEIIENNTTYKLEDGERHLTEGLNMNVFLHSIEILKEVIASAKGWTAKATLLFNCRPTSAQIADVLRLGEQEAFHLEQRLLLRNKLNDCNDWLMTAKQVFLKENSQFSLLQVLNPRLDQRGFESLKKMEVDSKISCLLQEYDSKTLTDSHLNSFFLDAIEEEVKNLIVIAEKNEEKKVCITEDGSICLCTDSHEGLHTQCNLCKTWDSVRNLTSLSPLKKGFLGNSIFLCRFCVRSKRPNIQEITALMKAYDNIDVVVPEGEALSLLLKRITNWEVSVKSYLRSNELRTHIKSTKLLSSRPTKEYVFEVLNQNDSSDDELSIKTEMEGLSLKSNTSLDSCLSSLNKLFVEGALIESTSDDLITVWRLINTIITYQNKQQSLKVRQTNGKRKNSIGSLSSAWKALRKKRSRIKKEALSDDSDDADDSDELCAAVKCIQPTGKMVDWVQCDGGCDKWYHMRCVGLKKQDISSDEEYVCIICHEAHRSKRTLRKKIAATNAKDQEHGRKSSSSRCQSLIRPKSAAR